MHHAAISVITVTMVSNSDWALQHSAAPAAQPALRKDELHRQEIIPQTHLHRCEASNSYSFTFPVWSHSFFFADVNLRGCIDQKSNQASSMKTFQKLKI